MDSQGGSCHQEEKREYCVATRDSELIAFIMAALHDLEVKETNVLNAFVIVPNKEFGDNAGKSAKIIRASKECRCTA